MAILVGTSKGVYYDGRGALYLEINELLDRFGLGGGLLARVRLRVAIRTAAREAGRAITIIERQSVSRGTEKVPA